MTENTKLRDPERTREAILEAAENLFARKGYEETSLQEIGQLAGVSRGTPNYFFGSKEQLYNAVLDRLMQAEQNIINEVRPQLASGESNPQEVITQAVSRFLDLLVARPTFVRLIEREALNQGRFLRQRSGFLAVLKEGLDMINTDLKSEDVRPLDPDQLLLSIIALCWFPLAHNETFVQPLGLNATDPLFLEQRKQHIIELVLHGILKS